MSLNNNTIPSHNGRATSTASGSSTNTNTNTSGANSNASSWISNIGSNWERGANPNQYDQLQNARRLTAIAASVPSRQNAVIDRDVSPPRGPRRCAPCNGAGRIPCRACNGIGRLPNPHSGMPNVFCYGCQAKGHNTCRTCNGKGDTL